MDKYLIFMCDPETKIWHITVQTENAEFAKAEHEDLKDHETASILIYTGDFIQV